MNAIERKLVESRLNVLTSRLEEMSKNGVEVEELESFKSELLELQTMIDGAVNSGKEKTPADIQDEYLMKKYGTTDPEKIKAIEKPSDDLLESILAPEGFNPNSAGMTRRV
jgi:hypothetical protein